MKNAHHPAANDVQKSYLWLTLGFFLPVFFLYAVYTIFQSRDEVKGSWLESHTDYQIRLISVVALVLALGLVIGMVGSALLSFLAFGFLWIWYMLRIANGWSKLSTAEVVGDSWI